MVVVNIVAIRTEPLPVAVVLTPMKRASPNWSGWSDA
jgi:hypothetical protein